MNQINKNTLGEISWVSEAYSCEPRTFIVGNKYDKRILKKILLQSLFVEGAGPFGFYAGYDIDEKPMFQIIADSANIGFK